MADPADKNDVAMLQSDIKDSTYALNNRIDALQTNTDDRFFTVGRDTMDLRAQIIAQQQQLVAGFSGVSKDTEISALKTQAELAKQSTYLSDKIDAGNAATQALINDLKTQDLNRMLIERNAEIVEERGERRHYRHSAEQAQWAGLQSQIQNFASQLGEAKASMVNFGLMAGVGQSATSNNVR